MIGALKLSLEFRNSWILEFTGIHDILELLSIRINGRCISTCPRNGLPLCGIFYRIIDLVLQRGKRYELSFLRTPKKSIPNMFYY